MGMVWVARLADAAQTSEIMADPDSAYDFINPEETVAETEIVDLDKEWHAAHHVLTGSAGSVDSPLSLILGEFEEIGEDNGYGAAWFIPPDRLKAFHVALASLEEAELRRRYNPDAMVEEQIYIGDMYKEDGEDGFVFLRERIQQLANFAARGAAAGMGAFAVIT